MRFVQSADIVPHRCAFYPQIGGHHELGFIHSDTLVDDYFASYASVAALRDIAAQFPQVGLVPRDELTMAQAEIASLKRENEDLKTQITEADKFAEAAEWTLNHFNTKVKQKPGRKPAAATK